MEQAKEYQHLLDRSNWDKALQYLALMNQSHPFLSVRAAEINTGAKPERTKISLLTYMKKEVTDVRYAERYSGGDGCSVGSVEQKLNNQQEDHNEKII